MKSRLAARGQIVIPKPLRDRLGLRPGQQLDFFEERGRLVAVKVEERDAVSQVYGSWGRARSSDRLVESLRGKTDAVD